MTKRYRHTYQTFGILQKLFDFFGLKQTFEKFKQNKMKKLIIGISAMLLLASAAVFANNSSTKQADCCAQGSSCCYPGSPCCNK